MAFVGITSLDAPRGLKSPYNPFRTSMIVSNLPSHITPAHIRHILSHPPTPSGQPGRRQDPGVDTIQIVKKPIKPKNKRRVFASLLPTSKLSQTETSRGASTSKPSTPNAPPEYSVLEHTSPASTPGQSPHASSDHLNPTGLTPDIQDRIVEVGSEEYGDEEEAEEENDGIIGRSNVLKKEEEMEETMAYLTFHGDEFWFRAHWALRRITIDGRKIQVRTRAFQPKALYRLWHRLT